MTGAKGFCKARTIINVSLLDAYCLKVNRKESPTWPLYISTNSQHDATVRLPFS